MNSKKRVFLATILFWLVATGMYAALYVAGKVGLEGAEGYESRWDWQLFFFALTRLPFLLAALGLVLWLESRFISERPN